MERKKNSTEEKVAMQAIQNNLEPGDSVDEHRARESGNLFLAEKEIEQQNNNL
ncbi:hypothetical protein [Bacillus sp. FJAT-50079]|uniref:hypothetical protein n=1 Tax=Bacillus sp. FJAT-50079 TaxID=2833577 RepID=UPI001BC8F3A0|nr:hypothetical protein [Bacillus sp. FJAT-50079]MBS4209397.1 hypothetical protein [Bacillus sp. FJAT-50079]